MTDELLQLLLLIVVWLEPSEEDQYLFSAGRTFDDLVLVALDIAGDALPLIMTIVPQ